MREDNAALRRRVDVLKASAKGGAMDIGYGSLFTSQECCAQLNCTGSQHEGGGDRTTIGNASRRNNRNADCVDHLGQKGK